MIRPTGRARARSLAVLTACTLALGAGWAAPAATEPACSGWFPDFKCDRSGRFEGFHKPIVQAFLFEDPFVTTGLAGYYVYHEFPDDSALGGGDVQVAALQARLALTDRLGIIATKDGRAWVHPELPLLDDREGWMNIAGGLKYALAQSREDNWIVSGILRFEFDSGSTDVLQGQGDGIVIPSISAAWGSGAFHVIGDVGGQIPVDGDDNSDQVFWHLYADYNVHRHFAPFVQVNGLHWVGSGEGTLPIDLNIGATLRLDTVQAVLGTGPFEGADVANLGSRGASGLDLVTVAAGAHFPITDHLTFSAAYERSVTGYEGIFEDRVTTAVVLEF